MIYGHEEGMPTRNIEIATQLERCTSAANIQTLLFQQGDPSYQVSIVVRDQPRAVLQEFADASLRTDLQLPPTLTFPAVCFTLKTPDASDSAQIIKRRTSREPIDGMHIRMPDTYLFTRVGLAFKFQVVNRLLLSRPSIAAVVPDADFETSEAEDVPMGYILAPTEESGFQLLTPRDYGKVLGVLRKIQDGELVDIQGNRFSR